MPHFRIRSWASRVSKIFMGPEDMKFGDRAFRDASLVTKLSRLSNSRYKQVEGKFEKKRNERGGNL